MTFLFNDILLFSIAHPKPNPNKYLYYPLRNPLPVNEILVRNTKNVSSEKDCFQVIYRTEIIELRGYFLSFFLSFFFFPFFPFFSTFRKRKLKNKSKQKNKNNKKKSSAPSSAEKQTWMVNIDTAYNNYFSVEQQKQKAKTKKIVQVAGYLEVRIQRGFDLASRDSNGSHLSLHFFRQ